MSRARSAVDAEVDPSGSGNSPPGVIAGVWRHGAPPAFTCAGVRDLGTRAPVEVSTVFRIGSVTKLVTATAVLRLRDEGRLQLDDAAIRFLPELGLASRAGGDPAAITIRQLLAHSAGLPRLGDLGKRTDRDIEEVELLDALGRVAVGPPGTLLYSNLGYQVLGLVVGRISGVPHAAYVRSAVLEPLGMRATVWRAEEVPSDALASGYRGHRAGAVERAARALLGAPAARAVRGLGSVPPPAPEPHWRQGAACGSGGLYSTAADVLRLAASYMPGEGISVAPILTERSRREALTLAVSDARDADRASGRARAAGVDGEADAEGERDAPGVGLGWHFQPSRRAGEVWWHNGGSEGYTSNLRIAPRRGVAVVALTNRARGSYEGPGRLARRLLRGALDVVHEP